MELNARRREEAEKEREEILSTIAENRRADDQQAAKLRDQNTAYRSDLLGQIDYNRRLRSHLANEQQRLVDRQKAAELEYQRKIDHLRDKPVIHKIHPIRRGLVQSQSAGPRLSQR